MPAAPAALAPGGAPPHAAQGSSAEASPDAPTLVGYPLLSVSHQTVGFSVRSLLNPGLLSWLPSVDLFFGVLLVTSGLTPSSLPAHTAEQAYQQTGR
jgi:hypothetical protein